MEAKAASANGRAVRSIPSTVRYVSVPLKSAMKRGPPEFAAAIILVIVGE